MDLARCKAVVLRSVFILMILFLLPGSVAASDAVRHTLSYPEGREQLILVRSEFPVNGPLTELLMPNWTPGSYRIREYAANVNSISAVSGNGASLEIDKISKDRWQVNTSQADKLVVHYEVFTPDIGVQQSWASRAFSLINGASVFLYTEKTRNFPQTLEMDIDADRGEVFTAMLPTADGGAYQAENYDELVDSPVVVAKAPSYRFSVAQQDYVLLNVAENESWDGAMAARDVENIVAETQDFWGTNPLRKPYWFLNFAVGGRGGLEHDHSTVIITGRRQMRNREDYIKWLSIVAHEFFHVWNIRQMHPAELEQTDYQHEQYTSQLWLVEGLTSYYDNLLISRAGLINPEEYLELLAKDILQLETTPGRLIRPVSEASLDTWIRHYKPGANTINSTISYYTKGALIGFVLDTYLRKESRGRHSLDEVMQKMYKLYSSKPYGNDAFESIVVEVGGSGAGELLHSLLTTTAEIDVDSALDWYGLRLVRNEVETANNPEEEPPLSGLGVTWDGGKSGVVVKLVIADGAGAVAGLIPQDEILAIGDERLTPDTLERLMRSFLPGEETTLLISRRGKVSSLNIKLGVALPEQFVIMVQPGFGKRHIGRLQSLLGQSLGK